jgi:hypothetical protein
MPWPLGVNPATRLHVERGVHEPAHVGGGALDVAAAAPMSPAHAPAPMHLDAVGQQLYVAVGLELLEVQPLDHLLHTSHPLSTERLFTRRVAHREGAAYPPNG